MLPSTGLLELDISRYVCPPGWEWAGEWAPIVQQPDTDPDGWRYVLDLILNLF